MRSIIREWRCLLVYPALLGLGAVVLASCTANGPQPPPQTSTVRPPLPRYEVPATSSAAPRPAHKPTPPPAAGNAALPAGEQAYAATAPKPTEGAAGPASSAPPGDLAALSTPPGRSAQIPSQAELIGLDEPAATRLFGPATEKSEAPPATVWRYKTAGCELDLFFYLDLRSGRMRTLHYAFKGDGADTVRRQDCLSSLLASRGG